MKMAPVARALDGRPGFERILVHTGQHYDDAMSRVFFEELGVGEPDFFLDVGSGTHAEQTARVLERIEPVLVETAPDVVLVPGDVNSTLAAALAAVKLGIPVGHVEAGLRSFDRTMPEELNRILTDAISDLLFTHSPEARTNLEREGAIGAIHEVGNTMIDTLVRLRPRIDELDAPARHGLTPGEYVVVTLHRPALVDGPLLGDAFAALGDLAREVPVVFPAHPRTRAALDRLGLSAPPGLAAARPAAVPRVPRPRGRLGGGAHRLGRDPGGDDLPRRPVLHAALDDRAAGHGRAGDEHAARARSGADPRGAGAAHAPAAGPRRFRRAGTATPPSGSSTCSRARPWRRSRRSAGQPA